MALKSKLQCQWIAKMYLCSLKSGWLLLSIKIIVLCWLSWELRLRRKQYDNAGFVFYRFITCRRMVVYQFITRTSFRACILSSIQYVHIRRRRGGFQMLRGPLGCCSIVILNQRSVLNIYKILKDFILFWILSTPDWNIWCFRIVISQLLFFFILSFCNEFL